MLVKVILLLLSGLFLANSVLFYKLWDLEERLLTASSKRTHSSYFGGRDSMDTFEDVLKYSHDNENRQAFKESSDDVVFDYTNATPKEVPEWLKLLHRQEVLHQLELEKWHKILGTATDLLRQVS